MNDRVAATMRRAMLDVMRERICKPPSGLRKEEDIQWVSRLLLELQERVCSLTPRRSDLALSFRASFDVDLLIQMMRNGAEGGELHRMGSVLLERLSLLCAPCQDESLRCLKERLLRGEADFVDLLDECHSAIDEIERLSKREDALRAVELKKRAMGDENEGWR